MTEHSITAYERLDGYLRAGLDLYLDADDNLRLRGPLSLRDAARPAILMHKSELVAALRALRADAIERVTSITARVSR